MDIFCQPKLSIYFAHFLGWNVKLITLEKQKRYNNEGKVNLYLQVIHLTFQTVIFSLQVTDAVFCLAKLSLQLCLQLTAALLELLQLLLGIIKTVEISTH